MTFNAPVRHILQRDLGLFLGTTTMLNERDLHILLEQVGWEECDRRRGRMHPERKREFLSAWYNINPYWHDGASMSIYEHVRIHDTNVYGKSRTWRSIGVWSSKVFYAAQSPLPLTVNREVCVKPWTNENTSRALRNAQ